MAYTEKILGIDLGTTNSVVAVLEGEEPVVIPNAEGQLKTPSIVHIDKDGKILVGEMARRMLATNPRRTVYSAKRLIGQYYSEIEDAVGTLSYEVIPDDDDGALVKIDEQRIYQPGQISAMVLEKLKRDAEEYLGEKITQAIITVPANFDDLQRQATKEAGRLAGLDVLRLVNEPTAAAMAYGLGKGNDGVIAVYDFGGGTFDVTLMEISGRTFEVIVCEGDSYLGGDDLDDLIVQMVVDDVFQEYNHDLTSDPGALVRLKEAAEKAKCELSFARTASISLPFLAMINGDPLNYERSISRADFEEIAEPIVQRTIDCCERALKAARMDPGQIDKVILVGGSTRMPMVQEMVEDFFGMPPHRGVNPDEVVALGAATQAGVLAGALEEVVLLDVTPRSLGLETRDDNFSRIIEKNSTIPIKMAKTFTTTEENQEMVNIHVLQGEEAQASANLSLGKFLLKGIQPSPAGVPRIRVTFQINADGILEISAQDMATGSENQLTITHTFLSEEERKAKAAKRKQEASGAGRGAGRRRRSGGAKRGRPVDTGVKPRRIGGVRSPSDTSSGEYASSTSAASETPIPARTPIPGRGTQGGVRTPAPAPQAPPMAPAPGPSRLAPAAQRTPAPAPQPAPAPAPMPSASPSPAAGGASSGFAMLADTAVRERPLAPGVGKMPVGSSPIPAPTMPPRRPAAPPAMELTPQQREDDTGDLPGGQEEVMAAPAPPLAPAPAARSRTASASSTGDDSGSDTGGRHHRVKPEDLMESGVDLAEPLDAPAPSRSQPVASTPLPTDEEDEEEAEQTMRPAPGSMATPSPISRRPSAPAAPSAPPPSSPSSPALPRAPIPKAPSREVAAAPAGESLWSPSELVEELRRDSGEALKAVSATEAEKTKEAAAQRCPQSRITEPMELAFTLLEADRGDENAISCYADALPQIEKLLLEFPLDSMLLRHASMIWLYKSDPEKSLEYYKRYRKSPGANLQESARILSKMVDRHPSFLEARRERAEVYVEQNKHEGAIKDLEFIINRQSSNEETIKRLETIYKKLLDTRYSPSSELKLIKVLLRRNKVDEAIKRLQNIVEDPQFRTRAQKVLGFCYWQKQMYYPAFLQFKNLALDDEIKDTIYRLANDMETKGDYSRALEAFEFLNDRLPGFRDVKEHIERIRPAANRQAGGSGPSSSPSGGGLGGGGGYDMLKGSRFIILEELNRGSMGIVYKAKDQTLNEIVALKVLNDYLCTDPLAIERFKREARAAKKLSHQHIIRIHDLFEMNDKTFLSMEFIDGDDLKKMLQERKRIPSKEVARIGVQICEALEYAHKRGVVHRDVKPANVIVESLEPLEIKVADFGIAKQLNADDMTTGSRIMGTPLYMAPEQIEGRQVDARSDIYSLGVMLYEMVSGIPPFCEGNIEYQHIHKDPPPLPADVDAVLGKVILKAIAKRKEGRYQSAEHLGKALKLVSGDDPSGSV